MARQGMYFSEEEVAKIVDWLSSTDMEIWEIAERMQCSRGVILAINRRFQIRGYRRSKSAKGSESAA